MKMRELFQNFRTGVNKDFEEVKARQEEEKKRNQEERREGERKRRKQDDVVKIQSIGEKRAEER